MGVDLMSAATRKPRAGKNRGTKKSPWSRLLDAAIIVGLVAAAAIFTHSGATGTQFTTSRTGGSNLSRDSAALTGTVPFVADQLLWFPLAFACIALVALIYGTGTAVRFWVVLVSGAAALFAICAACLALETIWLATNVPYTNYAGLLATWADPARYVWPIVALSVCGVISLAVTFYGLHNLRGLRRLRRP